MTTTDQTPALKPSTLKDYTVDERGFTLSNDKQSIVFNSSDELTGPLNKLRRGRLRQTGRSPQFYVLVALGVDRESIDEVWVNTWGDDSLEAITEALETLAQCMSGWTIEHANRGLGTLQLVDETQA
jgi:hypothetical protein